MYLIYGKQNGQKRFKAMDLSDGVQVDNLIYATMFEQDPTDIAKQLTEDNEDWTFEARKTN